MNESRVNPQKSLSMCVYVWFGCAAGMKHFNLKHTGGHNHVVNIGITIQATV